MFHDGSSTHRRAPASQAGWLLVGIAIILSACGPGPASVQAPEPPLAAKAPPAPVSQAASSPPPRPAESELSSKSPPPTVAAAPANPKCGLPEDIREADWPRVLTSTQPKELAPPGPGTITLALLPDTQYYAACRYPHLRNQSGFLMRERKERNIQAAITLGDLTDHNTPEEWEFFKASLEPLADGFPLLLSSGNHDLGDRGTAKNRHSLLSEYFDEAWAKKSGALKEVMTRGDLQNAFYSIDAGKFRLGVLMLEWSPRAATVRWANRLVKRYANHRVIVATHAYLYRDSTRYDYSAKGAAQKWNPLEYGTAQGKLSIDGNHDGEMLWNALIRKHKNIFLVVSGHVLVNGTGLLASQGDAGNTVHQVLANYQMLDEGGLGYLRLLELKPDGKTFHMKTYSPSLGLYSYAPDQDFSFVAEPPLYP